MTSTESCHARPAPDSLDSASASDTDPSSLSGPRRVDDEIYQWFVQYGLAARHADSALNAAFDFAAQNGRLTPGATHASPQHSAARAGLAIWRQRQPASGRGGPGRGQGRKARDGATDLVHKTINIRRDQEPVLHALGGSEWVRRQIDVASGQREKTNGLSGHDGFTIG